MKFGVELEFTAAVTHAVHKTYGPFYDQVMRMLNENGLMRWRFDNDASCGHEFVSPILSEELNGFSQVVQVCETIRSAQTMFGIKRLLGPDAGVHFHFDATDLIKDSDKSVRAIRNILLLSAILEPLWYSMNPGSRFETAFAAPLNFNIFQMTRARDMVDIRDIWFRSSMGVLGHSDSYRIKRNSYQDKFINGNVCPDKYDWTRYHGMNLVSLFKHKTFEFRYTHGSFDIVNIENWLKLYRETVEMARNISTRDIMRLCPMNMEELKMNCITGLQHMLYADLRLIINFWFKLTEPNAKVLKFIITKIIKYNPGCLNKSIANKLYIIDEKSNGAFDEMMGLLKKANRMESAHYRRNRYQWSPLEEPMPTRNNPDGPTMVMEDEDYEPNLDEENTEQPY